MNIIIRNLDVKAMENLDEMAKMRGISRQEFLKNYIETLSVLDTIRENDNRYIDLVNQMAFVIKENTNVLSQIRTDFILDD